jgi:hypothetical protein
MKNITKKIISVFTLMAVLVPNFVFAGEFNTVENLAVYPSSEIVNFLTSVGSTETREILIENTGVENYTLSIDNNLTNPFSIEGTKIKTINAQSTKALKVTFAPSTQGNYEQELRLKLNQTGEIKTITLKAHARERITNQGVKLSAKNVTLAKTQVGETTTTSVLLSNTNSYEVKLYASQLPVGEIALVDKIPSKLMPGESVELKVNFTPKTTGLKKAVLALQTTDYKKSYLFVEFMGSGNENTKVTNNGNIELSQSHLDLGKVLKDTQIMQIIQVRNLGNSTINFNSVKEYENPVVYKLPNMKITTPRTLAAKQTGEIKVVYKATELGDFYKSYTIGNSSKNLPEIELSVSGFVTNYADRVVAPSAPKKLAPIVKKPIQDTNEKNIATFGYNKSRTTINPDLNQTVLFGLNLSDLEKETNVSLKITNAKSNQVVLNTRYNNVLAKNQTLSFNGRNSINDLVSKGKYLVEIKVGSEIIKDTIMVDRLYQPKRIVRVNPVLIPEVEIVNTYTSKELQTFEKRIDESLLTQVSVNPIVLNSDTAYVSFNTKQTGKATVEIVQNNVVKKTVFKNRIVSSGFHYEVGHFTAQDLEDGAYEVKVTLETSTSKDTDNTKLFITAGKYSFNYYNPEIAALVNDGAKASESQLAFLDFFQRQNTSCNNAQDIESESQLCQAYQYAVEKGFINDNSFFRPNSILQRAEATKLLVAINDIEMIQYVPYFDQTLGFSDLDPNAWYMTYINTLIKSSQYNGATTFKNSNSVIRGYKDGTFKPTQGLSRAEFYKLIIEAAKSSPQTQLNTTIDYYVQSQPFVDTYLTKDNQWFLPYAQIVKNVTQGTDFAKTYFGTKNLYSNQGHFDAAEKITKQEVIEFIYLAASKGLISYK